MLRIQYKQAMPCVMFLYPKRAEECPRITNAAKQHENERLDLIALAHAFSTFLAQAVFYSCARENGRVDVYYDVYMSIKSRQDGKTYTVVACHPSFLSLVALISSS